MMKILRRFQRWKLENTQDDHLDQKTEGIVRGKGREEGGDDENE
jgi:hypothetical protein